MIVEAVLDLKRYK